jgi:glycosyltransferase involved in cell wall biosynthesis
VLFSIITPSFRSSAWLKLCIASVVDQPCEHEHIVQDSCSDDATQEWLPQDKRVAAFIEKDKGMYDAVNRGFRRARGDLLAYLNCDEQYLPGALHKVSEFFARHPAVDVLFADTVVVDAQGDYLCDRRALTPQRLHNLVSANLSFLTAATFIHRRVIDRHGLFFDPQLRVVGDAEWSTRAVQVGLKLARLGGFTSAFAETGNNLCLGPDGERERRQLFRSAPLWARKAAPLIVAHFRLRRLLAGHYHSKPYEYAIYTHDSPQKRKRFRVDRPTFRWRRQPAKAENPQEWTS